jgi:glycogen debranching enzyme
MVHFVPMQARGKSNSPFSIYDQLQFSNDLFDEQDQGKPVEEKNEIVGNMLKKMENEYGVLSLTDVVWNHTAHSCRWLKEHPETGRNDH